MGLRISKMVKESTILELAGILEREGIEDMPKELYGAPVSSQEDIMKGKDVIIDFSSPANSLRLAEKAVEYKAALVIGTTGLSADDLEKIALSAEKTPVLFAPNMSLGVNLLKRIASMITDGLPGFDKEIIESHHNKKADAPSGTALLFAEAVKREGDEFVYGREGIPGARSSNEIGIHAIRGGNIIGEHRVIWIGEHETVEIFHRAETRDIFAAGAVKAAEWLVKKEPGPLYSMEDVLF